MRRSRVPLVVYGDSMRLPVESLPTFLKFQSWLSSELVKLEARWADRAAPQARRPEQPIQLARLGQ